MSRPFTLFTGQWADLSFDQICAKAEVKKGSFYYFFDSKSDLAVSAITVWWNERKYFRGALLGSGTVDASVTADFPSRLQVIGTFPPGLPVEKGRAYRWRAFIDGESRDNWSVRFFATDATVVTPPGPAA